MATFMAPLSLVDSVMLLRTNSRARRPVKLRWGGGPKPWNSARPPRQGGSRLERARPGREAFPGQAATVCFGVALAQQLRSTRISSRRHLTAQCPDTRAVPLDRTDRGGSAAVPRSRDHLIARAARRFLPDPARLDLLRVRSAVRDLPPADDHIAGLAGR